MQPKKTPLQTEARRTLSPLVAVVLIAALAGAAWYAYGVWRDLSGIGIGYEPRGEIDASGFTTVRSYITPWNATATLEEVRDAFDRIGYRAIGQLDQKLVGANTSLEDRLHLSFDKALSVELRRRSAKGV